MKMKKWVLAKRFVGFPKESDLKLIEEDLPELGEGDVLFEAVYLSVDPYMRCVMTGTVEDAVESAEQSSEDKKMVGEQIAKVIKTRNGSYSQGSLYLIQSGWQSHYLFRPSMPDTERDIFGRQVFPTPVPDISPLPASFLLGCIGMPGVSAYCGLQTILDPKPGETVFVNAAAGAVGSLVGQLAKKIKGCRVIGCAGTDDKCAWLKDIGFDFAFNYKTRDFNEAMQEGAPNGVDCFFDNVGGDMAINVIKKHMNQYGRVALCGFIGLYNSLEEAKVPYVFGDMIVKQVKMEGFVVSRWFSKWNDALTILCQLVKEGKIKAREHVTEGFENMPKAFLGLLEGDNIGKAIVKA